MSRRFSWRCFVWFPIGTQASLMHQCRSAVLLYVLLPHLENLMFVIFNCRFRGVSEVTLRCLGIVLLVHFFPKNWAPHLYPPVSTTKPRRYLPCFGSYSVFISKIHRHIETLRLLTFEKHICQSQNTGSSGSHQITWLICKSDLSHSFGNANVFSDTRLLSLSHSLLHSISLSLPSLHCQKRMLLALLRSLQRKIYVPWLKATVQHDTGGQSSHRSHPFDVVLSQDLCNHFC